MSPAGGQHVVVYSLLTVGTLATINDLATGRGVSIRVPLGLAVAGFGLTALAESRPQLAASFALLILVSATFGLGAQVLDDVSRALDTGTTPPASAGGGTATSA